jgi:hypothetical protein
MASVRGVGARIFVLIPPGIEPTVGFTNFGAQLFAELTAGNWVMPVPAATVALPEPYTLERLEAGLQSALQQDDPAGEFRGAFWQHLLTALRDLDIRTDAETLMRLPFRLVLDDDARALIE